MVSIAVRKNADGAIEHYSHDATPEQMAGVRHAVCNGKNWTLYLAGDKLPGEGGEVVAAEPGTAAAGVDLDALADRVAARIASDKKPAPRRAGKKAKK